MKKTIFLLSLLVGAATAASGQNPVKAVIHLKDGKSITVHHFGKLNCESNRYAATFTILRGKYSGSPTEINDYKDISKLALSGFSAAPAASVGNQKGTIVVTRKNGVTVALDEAELAMSCFGPGDRYNEIHVQIINPLTDEKADIAVEVRKIESITF
jgi:hypothetical protein